MKTAPPAANDGPKAIRNKDIADRERLERFLPKDESLKWTGAPQLSKLMLRAVVGTAFMALIASAGIYFALYGVTTNDFCGAEPSRGCRKLYVSPWPGLAVAAIYTSLFWLSMMAHLSGLLPEYYGLTDKQAIRLTANPFDRFQSVKLGQLTEQQIGIRKPFGTVGFGPVTFLCLSDFDLEAIRDTQGNAQHVERHPKDGSASQGAGT